MPSGAQQIPNASGGTRLPRKQGHGSRSTASPHRLPHRKGTAPAAAPSQLGTGADSFTAEHKGNRRPRKGKIGPMERRHG